VKRIIVCLAGALMLAACKDNGPSGEQFLAYLLSTNEVPPLSLLSAGSADLTNQGTSIAYSVAVQNIVGITSVRIHIGGAGVVGPAVANLYTGPTTGTITSEVLVSGTLTASSITTITMDSLLVLMRQDQAYINVATTGIPGGEIRGQIHRN
jgi:hypothetical protein